ncbi:MAG: molecular chaperone GroEL [Eubacteriaceae bacterium]|nr:molecular chaperone GroEL [Eubacteriaceae bacterium]
MPENNESVVEAAERVLYDTEAREALLEGAEKLAKAVVATLGPRGRNVVFDQQYDVPLSTNDGVTIAKQIELEDTFANAGANLLKAAALETNEVAGDGTTLAIVLAYNISKEGIKNIVAGANPLMLKNGIDKAASEVVKVIDQISVPVEDRSAIVQVATIAGNNDPFVGEIVSEAFEKVGLTGVVTLEDSQLMNTSLSFSGGIKWEEGYLSDFFMTDRDRRVVELENPYILLADIRIKHFAELVKVLEEAAKQGSSLLVVGFEVEEEALTTLALNAAKGVVKVAAVKGPGHGDTRRRNMEALNLMVGGTLITEDMGVAIENSGLEICGRADRVIIDKNQIIIQNPPNSGSEEVEKMIRQVRQRIADEEHDYEIEKLQTTLSILSGGISLITVGGISELEMFERKYRIEDAIHAVYAAAESGVVPGGGKALLLAAPVVDKLIETLDGDEKTGAMIVRASLETPVRQIAENAGIDPSVVANNLLEAEDINYGYDALNLKYVDLFEAGIIDPAKVIKTALLNAVSASTMLLTTNVAVDNRQEF